MRVLRQGMTGADVKRWQLFLIGQHFELGAADGDFGPQTNKATISFQARARLTPDGIVGLRTFGQAMLLGLDAGVKESPDASHSSPAWPPRPSFSPLTGTAERQRLFGKYSYEACPVQGSPENICILGDWEDKNIVRVKIPQLIGVAGAPGEGLVRFHRLAADQLQSLWSAWEKAGLLHLVLTWDGSFVSRFVRGSRSVLSNHGFGTAFDINEPWNSLGTRPALAGTKGSVRELVPIANKNGFFWGGHYKGRPDGMHFEVAQLK